MDWRALCYATAFVAVLAIGLAVICVAVAVLIELFGEVIGYGIYFLILALVLIGFIYRTEVKYRNRKR